MNASLFMKNMPAPQSKGRFLQSIAALAVVAGLYLTSLYSYLLFHSLIELFSIVISLAIFVVVWNVRAFLKNNYLLFLGIACLFVGFIDLMHTLTYKGMGVFPVEGANYPTQLWIAARAMQAISLLAAPWFLGRRLNPAVVLAVYAGITSFVLWSIFVSALFPVCYIEGIGLTPFKKISEYIISSMLLLSGVVLMRKQELFEPRVLRLLLLSIAATVISELAFTFYVGVYDLSNLIGHMCKLVAFWLIYLAIIRTGFREPFGLIFRSLKQHEEALQLAKEGLEVQMAEREAEVGAGKVRFEELFNKAAVPLCFVNKEGARLIFNERFSQTFGYSHEDIPTLNEWWPLAYPDPEYRKLVLETCGSAMNTAVKEKTDLEPVEYRVTCKNGDVRAVILTGSAIGDDFLLSFFDITERRRADREIALLSFALNNVQEAAFLTDEAGCFRFVNEEACRVLGYTREELLTMGVSDIDPDFPMGRWPFHWEELKMRGSLNFEGRHQTRTGRIVPVEINANYLEYDGNAYNLALVRNITERKHAEEKLKRLNRELRAISDCNQVLIRATDETKLLNDVCRIICEEAGYRMAWVGYAENDEVKTVRPVAWAGTEDDYLKHAGIVWSDTERGRGPTGTSIRTGKSVCIQDFGVDPTAAPWKEGALKRGYRSSIALPLKDEKGAVLGALMIYSTEPDAFTPDEIRLLEELAGDLAFGITVLRARIERRRAEEEIRYLAAIIESTDDAVIGKTLDERIVSWNTGAERIYGYRAEEMIGSSIAVLVPSDRMQELTDIMSRLSAGEIVEHFETIRLRKDGQVIYVSLTISPIKDAAGQIIGASTIARDITRNKLAEDELRAAETKYRIVADNTYDWEFWLDTAGTLIYTSPSCERITGYSAQEFMADPGLLKQIIHSDDRGQYEEHPSFDHELASSSEIEYRVIRKDGAIRWIGHACQPVFDSAGNFVGRRGSNRDITERKHAEEKLKRLNRELRAISDCNQVLIRATDETKLLNDICRIICEEAGYHMAWVGYAENDEVKTVRPVAWAGTEDDYLQHAGIVWSDTERGRGPTGTSIRTGKSVCIQDFGVDPIAQPWKEGALKRGYRSSIALPLKDEKGAVLGALMIYSTEPDAFTPDEIRLLEELAGDLAFGITVLRARIERRRAEEDRDANLRFFESMDRINRAIQTAPNLEQMMRDVLDEMLSIFDCDRAFLATPCDPTMPEFKISIERTTPQYPGAFARGATVPMSPAVKKLFQELLSNPAPNEIYIGKDLDPDDIVWKTYGIKSQLAIALYPKVGDPWECGLHQCSYNRVWTSQEKKLFLEISRRLADALTSLLSHRDLEESEARYRTAQKIGQVGNWEYNIQTAHFWGSDEAKRIYGFDPDQYDFSTEEVERCVPERERVHKALVDLIESGEKYDLEFDIIPKNSPERKIIAATAELIRDENGNPLKVEGIIQDITSRKRIENALRFLAQLGWAEKSEGFLTSLARYLGQALNVDYVLINKLSQTPGVAETVALYARGEIMPNMAYPLKGTPCENVVGNRLCYYPHGVQALFPEDTLLAEMGVAGYAGIPLWDQSGKGIGLIAVLDGNPLRDEEAVTQMLQLVAVSAAAFLEREERDLLLRQREQEYRTLVNSLPDCIARFDTDGRHTFVNDTVTKTFGVPRDHFIGRTLRECGNTGKEQENIRLEGNLRQVYAEGTPNRVEAEWQTVEGTRYYDIQYVPERDESNRVVGVLGIAHDITERKLAEGEKQKLEDQLRHAQRLESVGILAGGVAHDFNNILNVIIGYGGMMNMKLAQEDPNRGYVQEILAAADRAAELTKSLLIFSRKQISERKPLNINDLIKGMQKMILRIIGEDIETRTELFRGGLVVMGDYGHLEQVVMNLVTNARDAMPKGGSLVMETKMCAMDEDFRREHGFGAPGKYALISVTDSGSGMDEQTMEKIFEPFFTTKEVGKGTGLGLSMVYGIVKQHDGYIDCHSKPGSGTTFMIYLPLIENSVPKEEKLPTGVMRGGTETILLAEDDAASRHVIKKLLELSGYTVIEAVDGIDAVNKFIENSDKIDLLLLDVIMPKKSGNDALEEIKRVRPDVKVMFVSGYTDDAVRHIIVTEGKYPFLQKPFKPDELTLKVREALDGNK